MVHLKLTHTSTQILSSCTNIGFTEFIVQRFEILSSLLWGKKKHDSKIRLSVRFKLVSFPNLEWKRCHHEEPVFSLLSSGTSFHTTFISLPHIVHVANMKGMCQCFLIWAVHKPSHRDKKEMIPQHDGYHRLAFTHLSEKSLITPNRRLTILTFLSKYESMTEEVTHFLLKKIFDRSSLYSSSNKILTCSIGSIRYYMTEFTRAWQSVSDILHIHFISKAHF